MRPRGGEEAPFERGGSGFGPGLPARSTALGSEKNNRLLITTNDDDECDKKSANFRGLPSRKSLSNFEDVAPDVDHSPGNPAEADARKQSLGFIRRETANVQKSGVPTKAPHTSLNSPSTSASNVTDRPSQGALSDKLGFPATDWDMLDKARNNDIGALEQFYKRYKEPLNRYFLRALPSYSTIEPEDLVQMLFLKILKDPQRTIPERPDPPNDLYFRRHLTTLAKRLLIDDRRANKREARFALTEPDLLDGYPIPSWEIDENSDVDREWAKEVQQAVLQILKSEYKGSKSEQKFKALQPFLLSPKADDRPRYDQIAQTLQINEDYARKLVQRFRERFFELLTLFLSGKIEPWGADDMSLNEFVGILLSPPKEAGASPLHPHRDPAAGQCPETIAVQCVSEETPKGYKEKPSA